MRNIPPVLGVTEVMELLGKSQTTVLRLARTGELVGRKLGDGRTASWAFTGESVAAYLDRRDEEVRKAG
jgi:predicted DNA-binding transcriptional regulator AlpA